jgi:hypothetical protein
METVKLGLSEVDITPDSPVQTVGFGRVDELSAAYCTACRHRCRSGN